MREEASWNPNHQTKKPLQQNVGVEDLMGFNEMNEGEEEEEIQGSSREARQSAHPLPPEHSHLRLRAVLLDALLVLLGHRT